MVIEMGQMSMKKSITIMIDCRMNVSYKGLMFYLYKNIFNACENQLLYKISIKNIIVLKFIKKNG